MFENKVVWITGASSGIGEALALEFASQGAKLILSSRREAELERVKLECVKISSGQTGVLVLPFDVTDEANIATVVEQARQFHGRIDMLINNAGISQRSSFLNTEMATYRKLFEVDVFGQIALTKAVVPIMIEQGQGHVAVTASVAGKLGAPFRTGYCAVKHAVMGFFDSLRTEITHQNIKVTTITPGFIQTNISENALAGDGSKFGKVDGSIRGGMGVTECAKVIMRGFHKGKPEIVVGKGLEMWVLRLKRIAPRTVFKLVASQYHAVAERDSIK